MATATATRKTRKSTTPKVDPYQVITDRIIEMLEDGVAPWHQPWKNIGGAPMSMSTKRPYRGINVMLLQLASQVAGYGSPWWGTYKQITERGGDLTGQKGTQVVLWRPMWIEDEKNPQGPKKKIMFCRFFYVFNADQVKNVEALGLPQVEELPQHEAIAACDAAVEAYYATGPQLRHGGDAAYYNRVEDLVQMPKREQFETPEHYYGALFHETVHSTGHASRLDRKDLLNSHRFGDESYSKEELTAELGSAFMAGQTGISAVTLGESAAYLQSWINVLKGDKKLLVQASSQAQKAVDLILGNEVHQVSDEEPAKATAAA